MSKISTREGKKVKKREKIGEVGMTGLATGNRLRFEIRKDKMIWDMLLILPLYWRDNDEQE